MSRPQNSIRRRLETLETRDTPTALTAIGAGPGNSPVVEVYRDNAAAGMELSFLAYDAHFLGGVHVATADVNGDGVEDVITGAGFGGGPHIKVFDGASGSLMYSFMAYDPNFRGGAWVAGADVDHDGAADIITGAGLGGGPHVEVFSGRTGALIRSFMAYDATLRNGVTVAGGDIDGDGFADVVTGAGPGSAPVVKAFSGQSGGQILSFLPYASNFTGGVFVAAGRMEPGSNLADIITGPGAGGGPHVEVFNGNGALLHSMLVYDGQFTGGIRVAAADIAGLDSQCICIGQGPGGSPQIAGIDPSTGDTLYHFSPLPFNDSSGFFVG